MIMMDLQQKETFREELIDNKKCCTDCKTTKTPLWRGGPAGPKTLCNACGIRYRKKRVSPVGLRLNRGQDKKREKSQSRSGGRAVGNNDGDDLKERLKMNLVALGEEVMLQRSRSAAKKQRWQRRRRELEEVEQAAFCLMALSCGLVFA